jgi:hypothetical protein
MGILATDILIKTMIEVAFADLRQNSWVLDDVFSGLETDPLAKDQYGYKEVLRAKQWFLSNNIDVYLNHRVDNPRMPCITVVQTGAREMQERASFADLGSIEDFEPKHVTKRVQKVYSNFTPISYEISTGTVTTPLSLTTDLVVSGQFLVSQRSGKAYEILENSGSNSFKIKAGVKDDFTDCYIAPPTSLWNLHRELSFVEESFAIGIHTQSDPITAIWLRQLMMYVFLRYKEAYLEGRGYEISTFSVGAIDENPYFQQADKIYSCAISIVGQVEMNWIKFVAPKLQSVTGQIKIADGPKTPPNYINDVKKQGWEMEGDTDE